MTRQWTASWLSLKLLFYLAFLVLGILSFSTGISHLVTPTKDLERAAGAWITFWGLMAIGGSCAALYFPASQIELTEDGTIIFEAPRRRLSVKPGELISVRGIWIGDPLRLLPFRVEAHSGKILLSFRLRGKDQLRETLLRYSPDAEVCQLTSTYSRAFSFADDPGVSWDAPTIADGQIPPTSQPTTGHTTEDL